MAVEMEVDDDFDIRESHVLQLLRASLARVLTLTEVQYLEQCIFSGPPRLNAGNTTPDGMLLEETTEKIDDLTLADAK